MRRRDAILVILLSMSCFASAEAADDARQKVDSPAVRVIVHPENPTRAVSNKFLLDAFLKKTTRWSDGEAIRPVDLAAESPVRELFDSQVLKRTVSAIQNYWQQQIFSGRGLPPPELDADQAVVDYVLRHKGAIGYVSSKADIKSAVVLEIEDSEGLARAP